MTTPPIALANHASGDGSADAELTGWCREHGIELRPLGDDFAATIAAAAGERPAFLAICGGDGTVRCAATVLADGDVPLLAIPGGTFNHFATSLDIADLEAASGAVAATIERAIPIADVNGEVFLNTCVIGWYPDMVRTREQLRERLPRPFAALGAFAAHVPRLRRFRVEIGGATHRAWLLWVGNGSFGTDVSELSERNDIADGVLDVRLALADRRFAKARIVWDLLRGRLHASDHLERFVTDEPVTAQIGMARIHAALDAEVITLVSPLVLTPAARHLTVLVPPAEVAPPADLRRRPCRGIGAEVSEILDMNDTGAEARIALDAHVEESAPK